MRLVILLIIFIAKLSWASDISPNNFLDSSERCSRFFEDYEKKYDLPIKLLSSVSIIETGRRHPLLQTVSSWPWSVNHLGRSFYFDTKTDAIKFVSNLIKQGHRSIDVGCMQVNLKHHPQAFQTLQQAFDPKNNIAYAAKLLKNHYLNNASWVKAIAHYHSGETTRGREYANKVLKVWQEKSSQFTEVSEPTKLNVTENSKSPSMTVERVTDSNIGSLPEAGKIKKKITALSSRSPTRLKNDMVIYNRNNDSN